MIQGHRNPFGKALRDYNIAELDFVLEMAAKDAPDQYSFTRDGKSADQSAAPAALAQWLDVLKGGLRDRYVQRIGLASGMDAVAAWKARQGMGLKPGLSRAGKPLPLPEDKDVG